MWYLIYSYTPPDLSHKSVENNRADVEKQLLKINLKIRRN